MRKEIEADIREDIEQLKEAPEKITRSVRTMTPLRFVLTGAAAISSIFRPSYYPTVGFIIMFLFTFLEMLPFVYKAWVVCVVYLFTVAFPALGIYIFRRYRGWTLQELRHHHKRLIPYVINILCYLMCVHFVHSLGLPTWVLAILAMSVLVQCVCTLITVWWKISMHTAGAGAIIGALVVYGGMFSFNPVWWLCLAFLVTGMLGTSRLLLRQHTLAQVLGGVAVGFVCAVIGVDLACGMFNFLNS